MVPAFVIEFEVTGLAETDAVVEGIDNGCIFFGAFGALVGTGAGAMLATVGVILRLACECTGGSWDEAPYSTYWGKKKKKKINVI